MRFAHLRCSTIAALVTVLIAFSSAPTYADDLAPLRKELVTGLRKKDDARVAAAVRRLCEEGSATAAEILINDGLLSGRPAIESMVREQLEKLPEGSAFLWLCTRCNDHKRKEVREQLVRVLTYRDEHEAFVAVLTALYDPADGVKIRAIRSLSLRNHRGAIPHLIKALEYQIEQERELGQIAEEVRKLLNRWMGKELFGAGEYHEIWRKHKDVLLDPGSKKKKDPLGKIEWERRGTEVFAKIPEFFGQEIVSMRVVFVMDTSISMQAEDPRPPPEEDPGIASGDKEKDRGTSVGGSRKRGLEGRRRFDTGPRQRLKRVQNELVRLISDLPEDFEFSIVSFDQEVLVWSKGLQKATKENKRNGIKFVRGFECDGETWTDKALEAAFEIPRARTIVLLSDGQPYRRKDPIHVPTLLDWVDERNRFEHKEIHTIGFRATSGEASSFLQHLSRRNHGKYTEIP